MRGVSLEEQDSVCLKQKVVKKWSRVHFEDVFERNNKLLCHLESEKV